MGKENSTKPKGKSKTKFMKQGVLPLESSKLLKKSWNCPLLLCPLWHYVEKIIGMYKWALICPTFQTRSPLNNMWNRSIRNIPKDFYSSPAYIPPKNLQMSNFPKHQNCDWQIQIPSAY